MDHAGVSRALFEAFEAGDEDAVRRLCTPDLRVRQNNGAPMNLDTVLGFARAVRGVVDGFRYEEAVRSATASGFVEEHRVRGTLPDGRALDLAVCVVADVREGRVASIREYFDGVAAAGLIAALS
jgi:ketosteroid isomerase-like protein